MNKYLEKLEDGGDARDIISNMASEIEERDTILNSILYKVLAGGDCSNIVTFIVNEIPTKCIQNKSN